MLFTGASALCFVSLRRDGMKRRRCRRCRRYNLRTYYVERPLRVSPFEIGYAHPSVPHCRDKRSRKDGTVGSPFSSLSLSHSAALFCPSPFLSLLSLPLPFLSLSCTHARTRIHAQILSLSPSLPRHTARRYSAIRLAQRIDACVHALSRSGMTGERIQFPSSLSCLHLQLGPRSDHPR